MIQLNLLPDIKIEFIKTQRNKRVVLLSAAVISGVCLAVMLLMFITVNVFQRKHLNDLNNDIASLTGELKETPDLDKILTVQNQLKSLSSLHDQKPVTTRLFTYVKSVTPAQASIAKLTIDFAKQTIIITGSADALSTINKYVDTLKFTEYTASENRSGKAFSEVVLTNFGRDDKGASYQIGLKFDPLIFNGTTNVTLSVPNAITTRSEVEKPDALFQSLKDSTKAGQ